MSHVDLTDLYPPTIKFYIYRHAGCCLFWIQKVYSGRESAICPLCYKISVDSVAGFPTMTEALQFYRHMENTRLEEERQVQIMKTLNAEVSRIEGRLNKQKKYYQGIEVDKQFLNGSLFFRWINWTGVAWPVPEAMGFNKWKNAFRTFNFGPPVQDKREERGYDPETSTSDYFKNLGTH